MSRRRNFKGDGTLHLPYLTKKGALFILNWFSLCSHTVFSHMNYRADMGVQYVTVHTPITRFPCRFPGNPIMCCDDGRISNDQLSDVDEQIYCPCEAAGR